MCDIDAETRRERYRALRKAGFTRGFAQRARDFSNPHYEWHIAHPTPWNEFRVVKF